jgi:hypothetical protein
LRLLLAITLLLPTAFGQPLPDVYKDEAHGDPPFLSQPGWRPLLNGQDLAGWHSTTSSV